MLALDGILHLPEPGQPFKPHWGRLATGSLLLLSHRVSEELGTHSPHTFISSGSLFLTTLPMPAVQRYIPLSLSSAILLKFWCRDKTIASFWMLKLAEGVPGTEQNRSKLFPWSRNLEGIFSFGLGNSSEEQVGRREMCWLPPPSPPGDAVVQCFQRNQLLPACSSRA